MLIEFSEFNWKFILFLIYPVCIRIQDYSKSTYIKNDNIFFKIFRCYLSFIFSAIFLLIYKIKTKRKKIIIRESKLTDTEYEIDKDNKGQIEIEKKEIERKKLIKIILFLWILSIIGFFSFYAEEYFLEVDYYYAQGSVRIFFEISNFTVLSHFILRQKLFKHHFISYCCITLMLVAIFIISFPFLQKMLYSFTYFFISQFVFAFYDVLIKFYMNEYFKNPYFIMFYIGLIVTSFLLIYDTIAYFAKPDISGIIIGFQDNIKNVGDIFLFLLDLLLEYVWNLGIWLLIFYFSPCHYFISDYVSEFFYFVMKPFKKYDHSFHTPLNYGLIIIFSLIIFFFCLIFNEVLILNFWGLDFNTRKRIKEREKIDKQTITIMGVSSKDSSVLSDEIESSN